jgi:hypothetical protein
MCYAYTALLILDNRTLPFTSKPPRSGQELQTEQQLQFSQLLKLLECLELLELHWYIYFCFAPSTLELSSLTRRYDDGSLWEKGDLVG